MDDWYLQVMQICRQRISDIQQQYNNFIAIQQSPLPAKIFEFQNQIDIRTDELNYLVATQSCYSPLSTTEDIISLHQSFLLLSTPTLPTFFTFPAPPSVSLANRIQPALHKLQPAPNNQQPVPQHQQPAPKPPTLPTFQLPTSPPLPDCFASHAQPAPPPNFVAASAAPPPTVLPPVACASC